MKHLSRTLGLTAIALAFTQAAYAVPTNIMDTYIGGADHGYGDVVGSSSNFDISSMDVERIGNTLSVSINTTFAGKADNGLFSSYTNNAISNGKGIGYGDLFLSSSWTPYGTAPYYDDNNVTGTVWSYGFSLEDRWMHESGAGTGTLYSLNSGNNNADTLLSEDFLSGATYRNGQEIAVDITNGNVTAITGNSNWDITTGRINFLIDLSGTTLAGSDSLALHWGMSCGNDVIEGQYTSAVPEPAILSLLAAGLVGIGISRRKATKA